MDRGNCRNKRDEDKGGNERKEIRGARRSRQRRPDGAVSDALFLGEKDRLTRPIERNFRWLGLLTVWQSFSFDLSPNDPAPRSFGEPRDDF